MICQFNKTIDKSQVTVTFHVDDLLITCADNQCIDKAIEELRPRFSEITVVAGRNT